MGPWPSLNRLKNHKSKRVYSNSLHSFNLKLLSIAIDSIGGCSQGFDFPFYSIEKVLLLCIQSIDMLQCDVLRNFTTFVTTKCIDATNTLYTPLDMTLTELWNFHWVCCCRNAIVHKLQNEMVYSTMRNISYRPIRHLCMKIHEILYRGIN